MAKKITVPDRRLLEWMVDQCHRVASFRASGQVRFSKSRRSMSLVVPHRVGGGGGSVKPVRIKSEVGGGIYKVVPIKANSANTAWEAADSGSASDEITARHEGDLAGLPADATFGPASAKAWLVGDVFWLMAEADGTRKDLTYLGEHPEEVLEHDGWSRQTQDLDAKEGVRLTLSTGTAYYDASDKTLYAYMLDLEFDTAGGLNSVSVERRAVVDVPEECTEGTTADEAQQYAFSMS
jgi:hypothetical protein